MNNYIFAAMNKICYLRISIDINRKGRECIAIFEECDIKTTTKISIIPVQEIGLKKRIPVENLLKIEKNRFFNRVDDFSMDVFFYETDKKRAVELIKAAVQEKIDYNLSAAQKAKEFWENQLTKEQKTSQSKP